MEKRFYTTREVSEFLRVSVKTLQNRMSKHAVYRSAQSGVWHVKQVEILEKVWAGAITEDEGLAFWILAKERMRNSVERYVEGAKNWPAPDG